jgi:quercetin dioxygenase-like cupin family protein
MESLGALSTKEVKMSTTSESAEIQAYPGLTLRVATDLVTFKAVGSGTNGAYSLIEGLTQPGQGVPPHRQGDDEAFFILEGTYTIQVGGETRVAGPGEFIFIPRGTVHAFLNTGDAPSRMLVINSPAGAHEQFFVEAGEVVDDPTIPMTGEPNIPRLMAAAQRHGIEMLT